MGCPQKAFLLVHKNVNTFSKYPTGTSYKLFETYKDFGIVKNSFGINVLWKKNRITSLDTKGKNSSVDFIDNYIDKVNVDVDEMSGVKNTNKVVNDCQPSTSGTRAGYSLDEWKPQTSPTTASYKNNYSTEWLLKNIFSSESVMRPQQFFKDKIDNSYNLWVPRIRHKHNYLKPLDLHIVYNKFGVPIGYEHPYKPELMLYKPPAKFLKDEEPKMPQTVEKTKLSIVNSEAALDALIQHLSDVDEIAIDIEHHSLRSYQGITCVIQISTDNGGDFIIDAIAIREHVHILNMIFSDPNKLKVMHGACNDIIWLQRDFGIYVVGLFDTHEAAKTLNLSKRSLQYLLKTYCDIDTDKKYQTEDWRIRPLDLDMLKYARLDTHYLLYIWRQLKKALLKKSKQEDLLQRVFQQSRNICLIVYQKKVINDTSHMRVYRSTGKKFSKTQLNALKTLYHWRDYKARQLDESDMYVMPDDFLILIAEKLPNNVLDLYKYSAKTPIIVAYKEEILNIISNCRELQYETCFSKMPNVISNVTHDRKHSNLHDYTELTEMQPSVRKNIIKHIVTNLINYNQNENFKRAISVVNIKAQIFVPPYERFKRYRTLAKVEEIKSIKNKKDESATKHHSIQFKAIATIEKENGENHSKKINEPASNADDLEIQKNSQICNITDVAANNHRKRKIEQKNTTPEDRSDDRKKNPYKYLSYEKFFTKETNAPKSFKKFK